MKFWIKDEDKTPQRFPLKTLIHIVIQQLGSSKYQLWVFRAQGYGLRVNKWNKLLEENDKILVERKLLDELSSGIDEWFYDLEVEVVSDDFQVRCGLHDSTALYIDAPKVFAESVAKSFKLVQKENGIKYMK